MNNFKISLKILKDILVKKKEALINILNISIEQESILSTSPSEERSKTFLTSVNEKQKFIDEVIKYDEIFQSIFDDIKDKFSENVDDPENKSQIISIQGLIKEVMEKDVSIRAQELKNNKFINPETQKPADTLAYRNKILKELNKHKRN